MIENILERNIYIYANIYRRRMMKEILEKPKKRTKIYNIVGDSEDKLVYSKIRKSESL